MKLMFFLSGTVVSAVVTHHSTLDTAWRESGVINGYQADKANRQCCPFDYHTINKQKQLSRKQMKKLTPDLIMPKQWLWIQSRP